MSVNPPLALSQRFGQQEDSDCDLVFHITAAGQPGEPTPAKCKRLQAEEASAPRIEEQRLPGHALVLKLGCETCRAQVRHSIATMQCSSCTCHGDSMGLLPVAGLSCCCRLLCPQLSF
jgi:hypothetical protein